MGSVNHVLDEGLHPPWERALLWGDMEPCMRWGHGGLLVAGISCCVDAESGESPT